MVEKIGGHAPGEQKEQVLKVTTSDGETKTYTLSEAMAMGFNPNNLSGDKKLYSYTDDSGNRKYTTKVSDLPSSIALDEKTGNIKITAPKSVTDLPEFKQIFDAETFKSYSLAYKLNPDYKVKVQEYNAETGQQEEKELTIPEWVKNRDKAIKLFMENLGLAEEQRGRYASEYGDKAYNMTPTHIMMTQQYDKYTYLPEILKNVNYFGDDPGKGNPFAQIWAKIDEDGKISAEDLKEIFNRDNFGRSELAGVMATINGALEGSDWGKEYYTDENGEEVYNKSSAKEAAKLIAFKNFLLSHHPDGDWWQEMGGNLETLTYNAMYGMTRVVSNIANDMEGFFSGGSSKNVQNYIKDMDNTMEFYNETQGMTSEATQTLAFLGMIGGTLAASWATGKVTKAAIGGVGKLGSAALGSVLMNAAGVEKGVSQAEALAQVISNADNIAKGANFAIKMATVAEKTALATNAYHSFMKNHVALNFAVKFLLDTIHDALLYDSTTLRDALESADGDTRTYWLGQLADNAKWWAGMSFAKGMMKFSGKTALGKAINVRTTRLINKVAAKIGKTNSKIKDKFNGGDLIRKLEAQIEDAKSNGELKKANRLANKKQIAEWNIQLREARAELGNLKLEWDGIKLTEESAEKYRAAMTKIKGLEVSIDDYRRSVEWQRQYMVGTQTDPATGKKTFINPFLGNANLRATETYLELSDLAKKHKLTVAKDSMISQDMINYWTSRYYEGLATSFMDFDTVRGAEAREALPTIQKNIEDAASRLPEEITSKIDSIVENKIYQAYYLEQNEYGMAHGLLNRAKIEGLHSAKPWKENGYMPIAVLVEDSGVRVTNIDGLIGAKIEADMDDIHFKVVEGQNYEDPELVRQSRLDEMAQLEVNSRMFKAYNGFGSTAANIVKISGEETEYARILKSSRTHLEAQVDKNAKAFAENLNVTPTGTPRRKPIKNVTVPESDRITIVASMSPEQVNEFLVDRHVLAEGETIVGNVTAENYAKWYKDQSSSVKKYLVQQYNVYAASELRSGEIDAEVRTKLAQDVVDNSNGEKILAWRSQSTGVDDFYGSAGGTGASNDIERAKWKGGRWLSLGGKPWSIDGYGDQKLAFPVNREDILGHYDAQEYVNTAQELYTMKYGTPVEKKIFKMSYEQNGQKVEDLFHYDELSKFKKADLKKVLDGDPRTLLDISGKKIINYDGVAGREFVLFPDRNPELLDNGISEMQAARGIPDASTRYDLFEKAAKEGGTDFEDGLERASLVGHKEFARSPLMNEARHNLDMGRDAFYQGVVIADIKAKLRNVKKVDTTELVDNLVPAVRELTDDYMNAVLSDEGAMAAIKTLSESTDASEQFARYIALRRLSESGMDKAYKALDNKLRSELKKIKDVSANDVDNIMKRANELLDYTVETELDDLSLVVKTTNPELVETKDIYKKADDLDKEIRRSTPSRAYGETTVMYLDDQGRQVFAEVDPAFASLYNYRYKMDKTEASFLAKINAQTARLFRYGTTTVNLKSFGNQLFRDFGNALYVGGSWQTIKAYRNNLVDVFGENIVDQIGRFDPTGYEMKQVEKIAEINGQTVEEAAISREFMRGAAISPTTTERTLYKDFVKEAYGADSNSRLKAMQNKFQKFVDDHNLNPEDWLNGKRENYLRNRVYSHSFNDALEQGYNLEQARVYAEFAMNNATTNFSRQLYHLQAIADSTPYFRAAINGTKSFWRMWSLDPVGISGRITGGLIIPVMYLTGASLGSEENRKVYENLPEYQKQDSLIFVINGSVVSAPLPQELSPIVAPFRQFVEQLYGTNKNDFWELMMNDVLGFFPYDLQGFSAIDMDKMIQDPTVFDRISRGVSRVFSQMAPIPVKTTYMLASGVDPYTGKSLRNPEYSYWNDETQSVESFDYNQNSFAKVIASIPGIKDWVTPDLAEKIVSGVVGTTGSNLLGDMTALFTNGGGAMLKEAMGNIGESISGPFTVPQYNLTDAIWKRAVRELTAEKDYILHSADMNTINKKLAQEKDPEKRKGLLSERQNLVNEFQNKVGDMVKRLSTEYQGTFDNKKFAAVIQLLNFNTDPTYQTASQYASDLSTSLYYEGRDAAIQTMRDLGIDGVHDTSIFGYLTEDKNGNIVVRYNSPIAIMDMEATWGNQKDYHLANIKALVSRDNLWDKKDAVDAQVDAIYAKSKLSDTDYDAIDAIYVNWNAEVMKTLAPYVNELTPEATINNRDVIQYLSGLIKVPGEFKKDKYGRYVTNSKLGGLGSANDAYIKNYIKYIFGINDTSYESGINFSDRTKYDKENKRWTK